MHKKHESGSLVLGLRELRPPFSMDPYKDKGRIALCDEAGQAAADAQRTSLAEERFRDFLETSADWLWETDLEQRFTYYSGGGLHEFGEPVGASRFELLRQMNVEPPDLAETIAGYMRQELPFRDLEYRFERADGTVLWI